MQGHHHFHYVRFLRYACLSVVPLIVLIILITLQSRQWASNILRQNTIDLLDKNTSLIDRDLSNLMVNIHQLDSDQELHELFATADYSASNILHIGRNIGDICNRYFFELPGAISLVFHTPQFTFPYYDKFNMPRNR